MAVAVDDRQGGKRVLKAGRLVAEGGKPLRFVEEGEATGQIQESALCRAVAVTLKAYRKAASELLAGKYSGVKELAPPHLRLPCHIFVLCCRDGILVRYDLAGDEEPKVRSTDRTEDSVSAWAPALSEQVLHFPQEPANYVPAPGPSLVMTLVNNSTGEAVEYARLHPVFYASTSIPENFELPPPPERPPCIISLRNELQMQVHGIVTTENTPPGAIPPAADQFIAHGVLKLPVGWQAIEVYPLLGEEYWKPEYTRMWAELDLLAAIAQANATDVALRRLDGRQEFRERYAQLLDQFSALLAGPEEPVHQFLKLHPEIICPTHEPGAVWSKLRFGDHTSDFVFREPGNDYLLVEIEAPYRELFRKDGHPRHELEHPIAQTRDWIQYIQDNKGIVEDKLGLVGISAMPRTLVIIGRSGGLTKGSWRALSALQSERPRLMILTYDQLLDRARANFERLFGPLSIRSTNLKLYFFRNDTATPS